MEKLWNYVWPMSPSEDFAQTPSQDQAYMKEIEERRQPVLVVEAAEG